MPLRRHCNSSKEKMEFSVKDITCDSSDCIISVKLSLSNKKLLFVFGVHLPYDNDISNFKQSIDIMQSLYDHYAKYCKVLY